MAEAVQPFFCLFNDVFMNKAENTLEKVIVTFLYAVVAAILAFFFIALTAGGA